jgi:hypothetical protein
MEPSGKACSLRRPQIKMEEITIPNRCANHNRETEYEKGR